MDDEIEIIGDAESVEKVPLARLAPDLIVLDVDGQILKMDEAMEICRREVPAVKVCLLSTHLQPEVLQRGLSIGANGYIIKDVAPKEFIRALKIISGGGSYVDPRIAGELLRRRSSGSRSHMYELHGARERGRLPDRPRTFK